MTDSGLLVAESVHRLGVRVGRQEALTRLWMVAPTGFVPYEAAAALAMIMLEDHPTYRAELLFSFRGVKRVEVPEHRIRPA